MRLCRSLSAISFRNRRYFDVPVGADTTAAKVAVPKLTFAKKVSGINFPAGNTLNLLHQSKGSSFVNEWRMYARFGNGLAIRIVKEKQLLV